MSKLNDTLDKFNLIPSDQDKLAAFFQDFFSKKPKLLHIVNTLDQTEVGGIEVYVQKLVKLIPKYQHILLELDFEYIRIRNTDTKLDLYIPLSQRLDLYKLKNQRLHDNLTKIFQIIQPDLINFHTLRNMPVSVLEIGKDLAIPTIFTVHGFGMFYPPYWDLGEIIEHDIFKTIKNLVSRTEFEDYYSKRFLLLRHALTELDKIITPSQYVTNIVNNFVGTDKNLVEIEHGVEITKKHSFTKLSDKPTIAWVSNLNRIKGGETFLDIVEKLDLEKANVKVVGKVNDDELLRRISRSDKLKLIKIHGQYENEELEKILEDVHIVLFPSANTETYNLVLSEAVNTNKFIISTYVGVMATRLTNYGVGELIERNNFIEKTTKIINDIIEKKSIYENEVKKVMKVRAREVDEMVKQLTEMYEELLSRPRGESLFVSQNLDVLKLNAVLFTINQGYTVKNHWHRFSKTAYYTLSKVKGRFKKWLG